MSAPDALIASYAPSGQPHMVIPLTSHFPIDSGGHIAEWPPLVRVDAMIDYIAAQPLKPPQRASLSAHASRLQPTISAT